MQGIVVVVIVSERLSDAAGGTRGKTRDSHIELLSNGVYPKVYMY